MEDIEYIAPKTIEEAVQAMASKGDRARAMAGGTDILVQMRGGRRSLDLLVDVKNIPEMNELSYDPQKGMTLGAATPCYRIYQNQGENYIDSYSIGSYFVRKFSAIEYESM